MCSSDLAANVDAKKTFGWQDLPLPRRFVQNNEKRWKLTCGCAGKEKFFMIATKKARSRVCPTCDQQYTFTRNAAHERNTVRMTGGRKHHTSRVT